MTFRGDKMKLVVALVALALVANAQHHGKFTFTV